MALSTPRTEADGTEAEPPPARKVSTASRDSDEMCEEDKRLAALGCTPVFKREFSKWSCFSFAMSISGLFPTIIITFTYPLYAGGAASVVWCWLIGGTGAIALALSIAEISSAYPTSGGMYFTLKYLCPESHVPVVSWVNGWLNLLGTVAGTASAEYGAAQMLLSVVSIASAFSYHPTQLHTIGAMAAISLLHGLINSMSTRWLNRLSGSYSIVHISVLLSAAVALVAMDKNKHAPEYVFTHIEPQSGWQPPAFSFWFGCLSVAWIIANCDGVGHIAEETKNPSEVVPWAITASALFTYVVGFILNVVLAFSMGNPHKLANSPTGMPVSQIFYNVMGPGPAVFFATAAFLIMNFVCIASIHAGSRTIWAFSRDEMLPLSRVWYRLHHTTRTPIPAVWVYVSLCVAVNLIGLGSSILIAAVFNTCAVALNWSYCIPILYKLLYPERFDRDRGPWSLGRRTSIATNIFAVIWNVFMTAIFLLPTHRPVTTENMNYAGAVLVAALLISLVWWFVSGRRYYVGPRTTIQLQKTGGGFEATLSEETLAEADPEKAFAGFPYPSAGLDEEYENDVVEQREQGGSGGDGSGFSTPGIGSFDSTVWGESDIALAKYFEESDCNENSLDEKTSPG